MANNKNDYSVIVFLDGEKSVKKWQYVHKLNGFALFLNNSHPTWDYMNVYERRTGKYLRRFKKGDFVPTYIPV